MIVALDIGGTSIKCGILDNSHNLPTFLLQYEIDSDAKEIGGMGIYNKIIAVVNELKVKFSIEGIAISTAGMVDAQTGTIIYANENIPNYTGMKLKDNLEAYFNIPCWVENDVNAAALGEATYGAGQGMQSMFMVTIGTGIGGAIILQNEVYRGVSGSAGEIGYMLINDEEFQDIASTTALIQKVKNITKEVNLDGREIFHRAQEHDEICLQEIDTLCDIIMKGICNCTYLLNPQMIVLGGGIMAQKEILSPIMKKYMKKYMKEAVLQHTKLAFAQLENTAGMMGAYAYFMKKETEKNAC